MFLIKINGLLIEESKFADLLDESKFSAQH